MKFPFLWFIGCAAMLFPAAANNLVAVEAKDTAPISEVVVAAPIWPKLTTHEGSGLYLEWLREIYGLYDIEIRFERMSWSEALAQLGRAEVDIVPGVSLNEPFLFPSAEHWLDLDEVYAFFRRGTLAWEGKESLKGRKLLWVEGYAFDETIPFEVDYFPVTNLVRGLKLLEAGHADILLDYVNDVEDTARKIKVDLSAFDSEFVFVERSFVAFPQTARGRRLLALYDAGHTRLVASGRAEVLRNQWR